MKPQFTVKQVIYILIATLSTCLLSWIMILATVKYAAADGEWVSSTISAFGNVLGGAIGGFVAYFAASYQVRATFSNERDKQLQMSNTVLALITEELHKNLLITKEVVPYNPDLEGTVRTLAKHRPDMAEQLQISCNTIRIVNKD